MSADLRSDYLYRGVSLSDGRPTLGLSVAFDGKSGVYAGASVIGVDAPGLGPREFGAIEYFGYAFRTTRGPTIDLGINNLSYADYGYQRQTVTATEVYAGLLRSSYSLYLHYSPNYFYPGNHTLYAEANASAKLIGPLKLVTHLGLSAPLNGDPGQTPRADARVGLAARFHRGEIQVLWSSARANPLYADTAETSAGAAVVSITRDF